MNASTSTIPTAEIANPKSSDNPYAAPTAVTVKEAKQEHLSNYQVHQLAHMLRAHGILTTTTIVLFVCAYFMLLGPTGMNSLGLLLVAGTSLLAVVLCVLTVMLAFTVFPILVGLLAVASLIVPVAWPFTFIAMHLWGRRTLKKHFIEIGIFGKPRYIAQMTSQINSG